MKILNTIILMLLLYSVTYSNTIDSTFDERILNSFNNASYIFEAEGIEDSVYHEAGKHVEDAYTVTTLNITRIFKNDPNDLQCGSIKVITRGGMVHSEGMYFFAGKVICGDQVSYSKRTKGVFFLNKHSNSRFPLPDYNGTNHAFFLEPSGSSTDFIHYTRPLSFDINTKVDGLFDYVAVGFWGLEFSKILDVYTFIYNQLQKIK